jgi:hypothetical protein
MPVDPYHLHKKFQKRKERVESKHRIPAPDTRRSVAFHKKFNTRAGNNKHDPIYDCNGCKYYPCGKTMATCNEQSTTLQCTICGKKITFRRDQFAVWTMCPSCKVEHAV